MGAINCSNNNIACMQLNTEKKCLLISPKTTLSTQVHKNGHNFACDQFFFETCTIVLSINRAIYPFKFLEGPFSWSRSQIV